MKEQRSITLQSRRRFLKGLSIGSTGLAAACSRRSPALASEKNRDFSRPELSQISYGSLGFPDRDLEAALDAVAAAGFAKVEILGSKPHLEVPLTGQELTEFRQRVERRGLAGGTIHAPSLRNVLGAPDEAWRREKVEVFTDYIRFTGAIGFTALVIHPVPNQGLVPDPKNPEVLRRMSDAVRRSLDELVPIAQQAGIRILLENLPYEDCEFPFLTMDELKPLVDPYPEEALGLVVDTGHAWVLRKDPAKEILTAGSRLWGTHLQDVDYANPKDSHWAPTHGGLDWHAIIAALAQVRYQGQWTLEVYKPRRGESPEELARFCRKIAVGWAGG